MTWTTPKTWVTGDILTAADLNTYVRDNTSDLNTRLDAAETSLDSVPLLIASDDTEYGPVTSTGSYTTLKAISSLSIPATAHIRVLVQFRKTSGAAAAAGLLLQGTISGSATFATFGSTMTDSADSAASGLAEFWIPPYQTSNYTKGILGRAYTQNAAGTSTNTNLAWTTSGRASGVVTALTVQGIVGSASISLYIQGIRIWQYA